MSFARILLFSWVLIPRLRLMITLMLFDRLNLFRLNWSGRHHQRIRRNSRDSRRSKSWHHVRRHHHMGASIVVRIHSCNRCEGVRVGIWGHNRRRWIAGYALSCLSLFPLPLFLSLSSCLFLSFCLFFFPLFLPSVPLFNDLRCLPVNERLHML